MGPKPLPMEAPMSLVPLHVDLKSVNSLGDLLKVASPPPPPAVVLPRKVEITSEDVEALKRLPEVFGRVVPTEKTDLNDLQVADLYEERLILDRISKLIADRKEAIRTTVLNAMDVRESGETTDKEGHFIRPSSIKIPDSGKRFSWEINEGSPSVDVDELRKLSETPGSGITHEDYIEMTVQTRVVDPASVISKVKEKPQILSSLPIRPGAPRSALYIRKG